MSIVRIEELQVPRRHSPLYQRMWREWCFVRMAVLRFRFRFLVVAAVLLGGGVLFQRLEPEKNHSLAKATYFTWSLVFGEAPEAFPESRVLQALFFIMPIVGLTVIIESLIELALMVRDRRSCERGWCNVMAASMSGHIVLVGLGRLGYRTFLLLRRLGEDVVVIERDEHAEFLDEVRRDGSPLVIGDARHEALLGDANVARAKSIVCASNDDLANLEVALDARRLNADIRVVLRMFDQNMADKIRQGFNIHIAMSQAAMSAPAFTTAAIDGSMVNSFVVGDKLMGILRWTVAKDGPLCGHTVGELMRDQALGVVERRSGESVELLPPPDTRLMKGDRLLLQGAFETLLELKDRARKSRQTWPVEA